MKRKYVIRTAVGAFLLIAVLWGYQGWNIYLDKQYEVEGVNWEVPLSEGESLDLVMKYELEKGLNELGLKAVYAENPDYDKREYTPKFFMGVKDSGGNVIIPAVYETMYVLEKEGCILVMKQDKEEETFYFYRPDGSLLNETPFSYAQAFKNGYAYVVDKDKNCLMDTEGRIVMETSKSQLAVLDADKELICFSEEREPQSDSVGGLLQGIMDFQGNIKLVPKYDYIEEDGNGGIIVHYVNLDKAQSAAMYLDDRLQPKTGREYWQATAFDSGVALVSDEAGWHIIDENEKNIADIENCVDANAFSEGVCVVEYNNRLEYLDTKGKLLFANPYKTVWGIRFDMRSVREGYILFEDKDQKWGYMDKQGNVVVKPVFDYAYAVEDQIAIVEINNRSGAIRMPLAWE